MATASDPFFRTFHALRIKGFAKADMIGEVAGLPDEVVDQHLVALKEREWAMFREARELWQLTPVGREEPFYVLDRDVSRAGDLPARDRCGRAPAGQFGQRAHRVLRLRGFHQHRK